MMQGKVDVSFKIQGPKGESAQCDFVKFNPLR